jgi:hypothetical protein
MSGLSGCILSTQYNMTATVLRQYVDDDNTTPSTGGYYETIQDPVTGNIERVWMESDPDAVAPSTIEIPCVVRAFISQTATGAGTVERFATEYENFDRARMKYPAGYLLTRRDRVTNIRNTITGEVIWVEEEQAELDGSSYQVPATIFEIVGVSPIIDPFGSHLENVALLQRAEATVGAAVEKVYA